MLGRVDDDDGADGGRCGGGGAAFCSGAAGDLRGSAVAYATEAGVGRELVVRRRFVCADAGGLCVLILRAERWARSGSAAVDGGWRA
jgi:hypothetical protein